MTTTSTGGWRGRKWNRGKLRENEGKPPWADDDAAIFLHFSFALSARA